MVHKLVWLVLDHLKDTNRVYIDMPEFTKAAVETFVIKVFGDKVVLVPRLEDVRGKQPVVVIRHVTNGCKLASLVADVKQRLSKTEVEKVYVLVHGLLTPSSKAKLTSDLQASSVGTKVLQQDSSVHSAFL